jgi:epoxyqueuosine reductase QueG
MLRQVVQPELKDGLIAEMKRVGAYDVRIADPHQGFEYAPEGRHPLELMPDCKSVVAFVVPCANIPDSFFVGIRRSVPQAPDYWTQALHTEDNEFYLGHRLAFLFTAYVILKAASYLSEWGFRTVEQCDKQRPGQPMLPEKLCAYEAGLGVYGRSGLILHPELGNRTVIGAFLTDARLEPDGKLPGFDPCRGCDACVRACPAGAYGDDGSYHGVWSREKCETTAADLMTQGYSRCTLCRTICPRGDYSHDELCVIDVRHSQPLSRLAYWVDRARGRVGVDITPSTL